MGFLEPMPITVLWSKKIPLSDTSANIVYVIFWMWLSNTVCVTSYVMEAGYLTNFIANIIAPNSKHFTYYQLNKGQIRWLHHFRLLVQVFFSALKNNFNIGTYWKTNMPVPMHTDISAIDKTETKTKKDTENERKKIKY